MRSCLLLIAVLVTLPAAASELPPGARPVSACLTRTPTSGLGGGAFGEVSARYQALFTAAGDFQEITLDRAQLGGCLVHDSGAGLLLGVEAVRSAAPGSLIGVDGDSIVVRLRYALASFDRAMGPGRLTVRAGLVPDPWLETVERRFDLRRVGPTTSESFFEPSDLGATVRYAILDERLALTVAYLNGEGAREVEQNTGKNLTAVLGADVLVLELPAGPLTVGVHGALRDGSLGVGEARNHRVAAAITAVHPRASAGVEVVGALGYAGRGERAALGVGGWIAGTILDPWVGLSARVESLNADLDADGAAVLTTTLGLYGDVTSVAEPLRLRLHLLWQHTSAGAAAPPLPGADLDSDRLSVVIESLAFLSPE